MVFCWIGQLWFSTVCGYLTCGPRPFEGVGSTGLACVSEFVGLCRCSSLLCGGQYGLVVLDYLSLVSYFLCVEVRVYVYLIFSPWGYGVYLLSE